MTSRCFARKRIGRPPIVAPGFRANELTVANKFLAGLSVAAALAPDRGPSARPPVRGCRAANGAEVEARYAQRELLFGPKVISAGRRSGGNVPSLPRSLPRRCHRDDPWEGHR